MSVSPRERALFARPSTWPCVGVIAEKKASALLAIEGLMDESDMVLFYSISDERFIFLPGKYCRHYLDDIKKGSPFEPLQLSACSGNDMREL